MKFFIRAKFISYPNILNSSFFSYISDSLVILVRMISRPTFVIFMVSSSLDEVFSFLSIFSNNNCLLISFFVGSFISFSLAWVNNVIIFFSVWILTFALFYMSLSHFRCLNSPHGEKWYAHDQVCLSNQCLHKTY